MLYLTVIGFYLFYKALTFSQEHKARDPKVTVPLGLIGGFLDASGGGGWGPVVTSNLLIQGTDPRKTIGTVNTAEFCLTIAISHDLHHDHRPSGLHGCDGWIVDWWFARCAIGGLCRQAHSNHAVCFSPSALS